jgi:hypothetical protein
MMKCKEAVMTEFVWRDLGNPGKSSVRGDDVPTEIRTEHLLNKRLERYRYANLLGFILSFSSRCS